MMKANNRLTGESVLIQTQGDMLLHGEKEATLSTATNSFLEQHMRETKRKGLLNGGEIGFSVGSERQRVEHGAAGAVQSTARNTLGSLYGNITVSSGGNATVTNADIIVSSENTAKLKGSDTHMEAGVDIIETTDKTVHEKSGLNIALSTPVTDALQSMAQSQKRAKQVTNPRLKQLYRLKAAQEAAMAAQNLAKLTETLGSLGNLNQNAAAAENPQIKIAVSVGTQKQESETQTREVTHVKTTVTGGNFEVTATKGKATFTGVDTQIHDTFRVDGFEGIEFKGVKDTYSSRTENKNHSGSVGVFVGFNGDSAGIGLEAGVSGGKGKTNVDSETWQVNNIQANKFIANSAKGKMVVDASQIHANRWEGETQGLEVISRKDTTRYKDSQTQVSASGSVAFGSGGSFSASLNHNSAKLNTSQVENQAGIFIGTGGMNATVRGNTHLAGAVIESQADSSLNTFRTQTLTTEDIENHSELKTRAVNAGTNMNPMGLMQNLLGNRDEESTTLTKAAISNNINLVLTDDPNAAQTLANLNRDTANANQKVTKHDLNQIEEQKEVAQVIGDISANTVKMYTYTEQQKVEKAKLEQGKIKAELEQAGKSEAEIAKDSRYQAATEALDTAQNEYDKAYGTGSTFHRVATAVTAAVQAAATGDNRQAVVNLASPYFNQLIKDATTDPNTQDVDKVANAIAHAVLGAVEAQVTNKNVLAGAAAGAGGEVAATYLTQVLYPNKKLEELSEAEKQQVVFLSQLAGGLAAGVVGDSSVEAASGVDIARRAVENNAITPETIWDTANIAIGVSSLAYNINEGNYGSAAIDAVGLLYDGIATVLPFLPAGASAGLDAYRAGNTIEQSLKIGSDVAQATKAADKAAKNPNNIVNNAAVTGTKIHRETGELLGEKLGQATKLSDSANSYFRGANASTGKQPDLSWKGTGVWLDLTTPNQWNAHVRKYQPQYGHSGIPILYKPNEGVINTHKLPVGAGAINGSIEIYKSITDSQEK